MLCNLVKANELIKIWLKSCNINLKSVDVLGIACISLWMDQLFMTYI